jgi:Protein of unknown function (DUF2490)
VIGYCTYAIYTGQVLGKFRAYSRIENPWSFWAAVLIHSWCGHGVPSGGGFMARLTITLVGRAASRWGVLLAAAIIGSSTAVWAGTGEPDEQLWTELDVSGPLGKDYILTGVAQLRLSETLENPAYTAGGVDLDRKTGEWTLGVGYRHQVTGNRQGEDVNITQVLRLNATWKHRFGRNTIAVRTRVENTLTASGNPWRVRLRPEYRWATPDWGRVSYLFANDEVYYRFSNDEFFRNRFQAGMNLVLGKRTELLVYYQRQDTNGQTPGAINALGLKMEVALD